MKGSGSGHGGKNNVEATRKLPRAEGVGCGIVGTHFCRRVRCEVGAPTADPTFTTMLSRHFNGYGPISKMFNSDTVTLSGAKGLHKTGLKRVMPPISQDFSLRSRCHKFAVSGFVRSVLSRPPRPGSIIGANSSCPTEIKPSASIHMPGQAPPYEQDGQLSAGK